MEVEAVKVWPQCLTKEALFFEAEIEQPESRGDEGGFRTMFDDSRAGVQVRREDGRRRVDQKAAGKDKGVNTTNRLRRDTILREMKMRVF